MLNKKEINILRQELNDSIINNENYETIYRLSTQLDKLIAMYYKENSCKVKTK